MKLRENKKGMALLLVLVSVAILTIIIIELNYNMRVSSAIATNYRDETTAYYLARSSVNVALLRIAMAEKAKTFQVQGFKIPPSVISMIVTLPFIFPPPLELLSLSGEAEDADLGMESTVDEISEETNISSVGSFDQSISSLDSKININVVSLSEESIAIFKEQMRNYYSLKVKEDETFAHRIPIEKFDIVLNNIFDWIDQDNISRSGGDERAIYSRKDPVYVPRNHFFPSLKELHLIDGMTDELFDFISPMVSVFSSGGININNIDEKMWKSIDNRLTDDEIKSLLEYIQLSGHFTSEQDLRSWIGRNTRIPAGDFNPLKIPLTFEDETYKIVATGHAGRVSKRIEAYVSETYKSLLLKNKLPDKKTTGTKSQNPEIIYWELR